jgi:hypothetical protein
LIFFLSGLSKAVYLADWLQAYRCASWLAESLPLASHRHAFKQEVGAAAAFTGLSRCKARVLAGGMASHKLRAILRLQLEAGPAQ